MGLPIFESPEAARLINQGDLVSIEAANGLIEDRTQQKQFQAEPIPVFMQELISDGGLIAHINKVQGSRRQAQGTRKKQ